jgi:RNA polymerase sigma-70 factor, ECF subfamily
MAESDQYYIERCLDGRADEFRYLVQRYQAGVLAFLAGKLAKKDGVEEAAQETFVRAYFALAELKNHQVFYSWLLGIASRVAKEQLRQARSFADVEIAEPACREEIEEIDVELEKAIVSLPQTYREIILMKFYSGLSCLQISQQLNMPIGTVTKQLSRAYVLLRQFLSKETEVQK